MNLSLPFDLSLKDKLNDPCRSILIHIQGGVRRNKTTAVTFIASIMVDANGSIVKGKYENWK